MTTSSKQVGYKRNVNKNTINVNGSVLFFKIVKKDYSLKTVYYLTILPYTIIHRGAIVETSQIFTSGLNYGSSTRIMTLLLSRCLLHLYCQA